MMTDAEREMELYDSLDRAIRNAKLMRMSHDRLLQALRDMVAGEPGALPRAESLRSRMRESSRHD